MVVEHNYLAPWFLTANNSYLKTISDKQTEHRVGVAYPTAAEHHLKTLGKDFAKFQFVVACVMTSIFLNDFGHVFAKSIYIATNLHFHLLGSKTCARAWVPSPGRRLLSSSWGGWQRVSLDSATTRWSLTTIP